MKSIPLRNLLRESLKVKRLTRSGPRKPLWVIQPGAQAAHDPERSRAIDALLEGALRAPRSPVSAVALLEQSRR